VTLTRLDATAIGRAFTTSGSVGHPPIRPVARFVTIGVCALLLTLVLATLEHVLVGPAGHRPSISVLIDGPRTPALPLSFALLGDPVGLAVLVVTLATPIFCAVQAEAIGDLVPMIASNSTTSGAPVQGIEQINAVIGTANQRFRWIGSPFASVGVLLVAALSALALFHQLTHTGLLANWNATQLSNTRWRQEVYNGWWANPNHHLTMAIALCVLGTYMFYFLEKQLLMGLVFAAFGRAAMQAGLKITPNLRYNSDGYHGLRALRRFMRWTYGSSVVHFALLLGVFFVWLPVTPATYLFFVVVLLTNATVVIYPSVIAQRTAVAAKTEYAKRVYRLRGESRLSRQAQIDQVWSTPSFPFRTRSSLTALTIYLVLPMILAIVSSVLTK
jgi:hypothetical protein